MITLHFQTVAEFVEWLPATPPYAEGDAAWQSREHVAVMLNLSEPGFDSVRRRLGKPFEHKDKRGRVWIYCPHFLRLYFPYKHQSE